MRQAMNLGGLLAAGRAAVGPAGGRGRLGRRPGRAVRPRCRRRRASPTTTSAPPTAVDLAAFRIARRPVTNGSWLTFAEGGGLERREWWTRRGLGLEGVLRRRRLSRCPRRAPRRPGHPPDVVRGRRLRPRAPRAPADRGRVGEGGDLEAPRRRGGAAGHRPGVGVDGVGVHRATRASSPTPTASTPRSSSTAATASCAAARGRRTRASPPRRSATGTSPQRRQIFAGVRLARDEEA